MDTGKTYIKMCKKAEEVQGIAEVQNYDSHGNYYADDRTMVSWFYCDCGIFVDSRHDDYVIWLPRQDQLQEMVIEKGEWITDEIYRLVCDFSTFVEVICVMGRGDYRLRDFKSYEQLWLAFVMREKYGKVWNGEDWVKSEVLVNQGGN